MDIFYAFDDAYAALAGISIFSLLVNNRDCDSIRFFIVDSGISKINKDKIRAMIEDRGRSIRFLEMPGFSEILGERIDTGRWNINVYSKLFVGSILPDDVSKVISIDCDTVVVHSIEALWNIDIRKAVVAGVNEAMSGQYRYNLGKQGDDYYLNSGLLMLNVDALRKESYEQKFMAYMKKFGSSLAYLDQDVINAVVPQDKIIAVSPKYNAITPVFCCSYKALMKARRASSYYPEDVFAEAKSDPVIIHFTTFFMNDLRPWFEGSRHPKLNEFLKYKMESPWRDEPLWKDNRQGKAKIKAKLIKVLPQSVQCEISSVLHGIIVPRKTRKKMEKTLGG